MKKSTSGGIFAFTAVLLVAAVIAVSVWLTASHFGQDNPSLPESTAQSSAPTSQPSEASSVPVPSLPDESSLPEESKPEESKPEIPPKKETEEEYAKRVGKEYKIDMTEYLPYILPENEEEFLVLVNSTHLLTAKDVPDDLKVTSHTRKDGRAGQKLRLNAERALDAFLKEAAAYGYTDITVTSAYRSYEYQNQLFSIYCEQEKKSHPGYSDKQIEEIVLKYSMKPGMSEHQTGLALDMHNLPSASTAFGKTEQAKWLAENAHRFGFILRFMPDKTEITGVQYEPWHFRFVGRRVATEIYEKHICFEEYTELLKSEN